MFNNKYFDFMITDVAAMHFFRFFQYFRLYLRMKCHLPTYHLNAAIEVFMDGNVVFCHCSMSNSEQCSDLPKILNQQVIIPWKKIAQFDFFWWTTYDCYLSKQKPGNNVESLTKILDVVSVAVLTASRRAVDGFNPDGVGEKIKLECIPYAMYSELTN